MIDCPLCGCKDFGLELAGPHIKAICKSCGEAYRARGTAVQYVQQSISLTNEEPATDKQINYIKLLAQKYTSKLPKAIAGDIISVYKKVMDE